MISTLPIRGEYKTVIQVEMRDERGNYKQADQLSIQEAEALAFKLLDLVEASRVKS